MKRFYFISILITICGLTAMAQNRPDLTHQTGGGDRTIFNIVVDKPALSFDRNNHEITVQGNNSEFYAVSVTLEDSQALIFETVIDGEYDVIDVSMLTSGNYVIALTSSHGNIYTWNFNQASGLTFGAVMHPVKQAITGVTGRE